MVFNIRRLRLSGLPSCWEILQILRWDKVRLSLRHPKWRSPFSKDRSSAYFCPGFFLWAYNGRNLVLISPGCYDNGAKEPFPFLSLYDYFFLAATAKIWFHSNESNDFSLSPSPGGVSIPPTAQTDS